MAHPYLRAVSTGPTNTAPRRTFEELLAAHLDPLYRAALSHSRGDAREAEALLQAMVREAFWQVDQLQGSEDPRGWFFTMLSRTWQLRRRAGGPPLVLLSSRKRRASAGERDTPSAPPEVRERLFYTVAGLRAGARLFRRRGRRLLLVAGLLLAVVAGWTAAHLISGTSMVGEVPGVHEVHHEGEK